MSSNLPRLVCKAACVEQTTSKLSQRVSVGVQLAKTSLLRWKRSSLQAAPLGMQHVLTWGGAHWRRMAFGSNGIYVGGKDTFISELSGNWAVHGELAAISVTGAPGPIGRITVELGSAPPSSLAKYAMLVWQVHRHIDSIAGLEPVVVFPAMHCVQYR